MKSGGFTCPLLVTNLLYSFPFRLGRRGGASIARFFKHQQSLHFHDGG
jgi:hypothetical protein